MDYATTIRSLLEAAERAAEAGDFAAAGAHLRATADQQEAHLGASHPDLANTLNNLGVVLERTGDDAGAESAYRRAYAIAQASLAPDHPFVATSAANLRDFCAARGLPFERPQASSAAEPPAVASPAPDELSGSDVFLPEDPLGEVAFVPAVDSGSPGEARAMDERVAPVFEKEDPVERASWAPADAASDSSTAGPRFRPAVLAGGIAAIALSALAIWASLRGSDAADPAPAAATIAAPDTGGGSVGDSENSPAAGSSRGTSRAPREPDAPTPNAAAGAPPAPPASAGRPSSPAPAAVAPGANAGAPAPAATAPAGVTVVRADVCRTFSATGDWSCDPVDGSVGPGRLVFYTRVRSASPLAIEHRWYHGDDLVQRVPLRIGANPGAGYRTFSRQTVGASRAGGWRAELRTADGTLLAEVRFDVK